MPEPVVQIWWDPPRQTRVNSCQLASSTKPVSPYRARSFPQAKSASISDSSNGSSWLASTRTLLSSTPGGSSLSKQDSPTSSHLNLCVTICWPCFPDDLLLPDHASLLSLLETSHKQPTCPRFPHLRRWNCGYHRLTLIPYITTFLSFLHVLRAIFEEVLLLSFDPPSAINHQRTLGGDEDCLPNLTPFD